MPQQLEQAQMGQGSQVVQSFENVDVNPFIVKDKHKTAAKVQLKRPNGLNPVQDKRNRDHSIGGSSDGGDKQSLQGSAIGMQQSHGYLSNGLQTDTESARLSNVQPYKFNTNAGGNRKGNSNKAMNIRKVNPT
jgi:hypothetical protein